MKLSRPLLVAFTLALAAAFPFAAAAHPQGPGYWPGYGPGHHHGPPPHSGPPHIPRMHQREHRGERPELSSEQREALRELRREHRPAMRDLSREIRDNGVKLRRMLEDDGYNDEYEQLARKQGDLIGRMIAARGEMQTQVREILGDDYKPRRHGHRGPWHGKPEYGYWNY